MDLNSSDIFNENLKLVSRLHPLYLDLIHKAPDILQEEETFSPINLDDIAGYQGLFIYGLRQGKFLEYLFTWLDGDEKRRLIVCENNPATYRAFFHTEKAASFIEKKRLHLILGPNGKDESSQKYLTDIVAQTIRLLNLESAGFIEHPMDADTSFERKKNYEDAIQNGLSCFYAADHFLKGNKYSMCSNIMENLSMNKEFILLEELKDKFKNIPIVLCAAGFSLPKVYEKLKDIQSHTLIAAAGTGSAMLAKNGIESHFNGIMDASPNKMLTPQYNTQSGAVFFLPRSGSQAVSLHQGIKILSRTEPTDAFFHQFFTSTVEPFVAYNFLTVSDFMLQQLLYLGFGPIYLCGLDHIMDEEKYYGENVLGSKSNKCDKKMFIKAKNFKGEDVITKCDWAQGSKSIAALAKQYSDTKIYYVTDEGLEIENVTQISTEEFNNLSFPKIKSSEDQYLPLLLNSAMTQYDDQVILDKITQLKESIKRCFEIFLKTEQELGILFSSWQVVPIDALNPYTGIFFNLQCELEKEDIYKSFLKPSWNTFRHQLHSESGFFEDIGKVKITLFGLKIRELDYLKSHAKIILRLFDLQEDQIKARKNRYGSKPATSQDTLCDLKTSENQMPCQV